MRTLKAQGRRHSPSQCSFTEVLKMTEPRDIPTAPLLSWYLIVFEEPPDVEDPSKGKETSLHIVKEKQQDTSNIIIFIATTCTHEHLLYIHVHDLYIHTYIHT